MLGINLEHFGLGGPMFVELGRQFDVVRLYIVGGIVVHVVEHEVHGMAELMEHGGDVVDALQGGTFSIRTCHVADIDGDGNLSHFVAQ